MGVACSAGPGGTSDYENISVFIITLVQSNPGHKMELSTWLLKSPGMIMGLWNVV